MEFKRTTVTVEAVTNSEHTVRFWFNGPPIKSGDEIGTKLGEQIQKHFDEMSYGDKIRALESEVKQLASRAIMLEAELAEAQRAAEARQHVIETAKAKPAPKPEPMVSEDTPVKRHKK